MFLKHSWKVIYLVSSNRHTSHDSTYCRDARNEDIGITFDFFYDRTEIRVFVEIIYPIRCLNPLAEPDVPTTLRGNIVEELSRTACTQVPISFIRFNVCRC